MNSADVIKMASEAAWPVLVLLIPLIVKQVVGHWKDKEQQKIFVAAVEAGYLVVHQISRKTENKIDDKVAEALKVIKDVLGRELTTVEVVKASSLLKAKHESIKFPNLLTVIGGIFNNKE